jgi:polysaccharide export outer membrane protein
MLEVSWNRRIPWVGFALLLWISVAFGQVRVAPVAPPGATKTPQASDVVSGGSAKTASDVPNSEVLIGDGDLLQVSLYGQPDYSAQVRVDGEGQITLPLIGKVKVGGLSPPQAEELVGNCLKDKGYFKDPQVSILDREFANQGISVLGEVAKPGVYPILGHRKLFDLISAAGGTSPTAGREVLISHRSNPGKTQTVTLSSDSKQAMDANVDVYPGDTVVVSKAGVVYVVGDVHLPGGFILDKSKELTVLQALALAQGANSFAALNHSKLIHKTPGGAVETPIYLKKILEGKAEDLKLQADDIVFIPHNGSKEAVGKGVQTALQTAAGIKTMSSA